MTEEFFDAKAAARYKGCSPTTLYRYLNTPELKEKWFPRSFAAGSTRRKQWVVYKEELDAWVIGGE